MKIKKGQRVRVLQDQDFRSTSGPLIEAGTEGEVLKVWRLGGVRVNLDGFGEWYFQQDQVELVEQTNLPLSLENCYAGKRRAEIMVQTPEPDEVDDTPYLYLQFVEGCGYTPYRLTPDEAEKLAEMLVSGARRQRFEYEKAKAAWIDPGLR